MLLTHSSKVKEEKMQVLNLSLSLSLLPSRLFFGLYRRRFNVVRLRRMTLIPLDRKKRSGRVFSNCLSIRIPHPYAAPAILDQINGSTRDSCMRVCTVVRVRRPCTSLTLYMLRTLILNLPL